MGEEGYIGIAIRMRNCAKKVGISVVAQVLKEMMERILDAETLNQLAEVSLFSSINQVYSGAIRKGHFQMLDLGWISIKFAYL